MRKSDNPLMALCVAASILEEREASALQKESSTTEENHEKLNESDYTRKFKENNEEIVKLARNSGFKPYTQRIPNYLVAEYIENTSDELSKRFSYKCRYSPGTCSKVVESYGSEVKAFSEIKQHVFNYHILENSTIKKQEDEVLRPSGEMSKFKPRYSKRISSVKTVETVFERASNRYRACPGQTVEKTLLDMFPASLYSFLKAEEIFALDTLKFGQFEHNYAQMYGKPSKKPVCEAVEIDDDYKTWLSNHLSRQLNGDSYLFPPVIPTAPFPFVFDPQPPEPAMVVELQPNGDPVDLNERTFFKSSTCRILPKEVENKVGEKSKSSQMASEPILPMANVQTRSVLECVENRVTGKSSDSPSDQKDALVASNSIENSENVEKSIHDIAWRNIHILCEQRSKRKFRNKPSVYICEICDKSFTANTSLTYHYMGHLKIKPFKCEICYRTFTRRHSLKYHMMIHANKTRFKCSTCQRLFRHPSHYREHLRKHTGEEPYPCQFCSNKFKTRNSYKRHLKMQHQKILTPNGIEPVPDKS